MNRLFIRADANTKIGTGHVMRCIALGQAWQDRGGEVVFISNCESVTLKKRLIEEGFDVISISKPYPDNSDLEQTIRSMLNTNDQPSTDCWLVLDGYHFDAEYQKRVKEANHKLLVIDDYGHAQHYYADVVLNQNISADESYYTSREPYTNLLLGIRYVLLRREFMQWRNWQRKIPPLALRVLVTLGGGDPDNVTLTVIKSLSRINIAGLEVKVIIGPTNSNTQTLEEVISNNSDFQMVKNALDMPSLMAWADIAVSAGGSTCWEMALLGLPNLIIVCALNQIGNAKKLDKEAMCANLGWHQSISEEEIVSELKHLMRNSKKRLLMSQKLKTLIDGCGVQRVCNIIESSRLKIRPMLWKDCEKVWQWVNDKSVRSVSFSEDLITWKEHVNWFKERINYPFFYMVLNQNELPVGQVRFDQKNSETVISLMVDSVFRNRGYGTTMIMIGCDEIFSETEVTDIHAYVKPDNEISRIAFAQAGFKELPLATYKGHTSCHFILSKH